MSVESSVEEFHVYQDVLAKVSSDGRITWVPPVRVRSRCTMDLSRYPRDEHNCTVIFGSWAYISSEINFTAADVASGFDSEEKEWQIISTEGKSYEKKYPCCSETFSHISITLRLKRNSLFITRIVIIPGVLLALLVPFQMLLPPESNERMTLGKIFTFSQLKQKCRNLDNNIHSDLYYC
ncbi:neuronal acetylcholine receptor subunit alpha-6-like [Gigantopelta aegis]|uniref:neuronal acetylcholine receptor subunit alpha-6-like n=1 Tax=Gigantopelta aegis TaxID=1735272 RepID=UPI001B88BCDA|nr:neuronal acetylcholine receptor subunit alpha-6-like [Gigantopelta aegis]